MAKQMAHYGMTTVLSLPHAAAVERVRDELATEGFGILSEIDVAATLQRKLGVEVRPYRILGACNPPLAHRALTLEPSIGLLLPCNVVVYEGDTPETSVVSIMDPEQAMQLAAHPDVRPLALEAKARLQRVLDRLRLPAPAAPAA